MTRDEFLTKHGQHLSEDLTKLLMAREETEQLYGRIFRKDTRVCIHNVLLGDHCHDCPQCKCAQIHRDYPNSAH